MVVSVEVFTVKLLAVTAAAVENLSSRFGDFPRLFAVHENAPLVYEALNAGSVRYEFAVLFLSAHYFIAMAAVYFEFRYKSCRYRLSATPIQIWQR